MNERDWVKIYSTDVPYKAEMLKAIFKENDIECIDINKKDTVYGTFGEIELYTLREMAVKALHIISKQEL